MSEPLAIPDRERGPVPHLTTALSGPLRVIEESLIDRRVRIESWFRNEWRRTPAPFYGSVDLRNAGFKIAPVDTNLFPAGFNNLNSAFEPLCIQAVQQTVERLSAPVDRILIIPENHTRNPFYLEHLSVLQRIVRQAGFQVRIGSLLPELAAPRHIALTSGGEILLEPLRREGDCIRVNGFTPELIILNNDLSAGRPGILERSRQIVIPDPRLGWSDRSKTGYFHLYQKVIEEFARQVELTDPWLLQPLFHDCGEIDFMKREGESCLQNRVFDLLAEIRFKYREYGVESQPFAVIKADRGTYGMAVMTVRDPDEIVELNRKQRTRMATSKDGQRVTRVLIQEGIPTHETWGEPSHVAEPVVYTIGRNVVGGFYRVHRDRSPEENLNAPGMHFEPLAFEDCCITPDPSVSVEAHCNRFYSYGVVGRLAILAAAREAHLPAEPAAGGAD